MGGASTAGAAVGEAAGAAAVASSLAGGDALIVPGFVGIGSIHPS
jgi:hypothetical protein